MSGSEKLFAALGGVDEALLARSEKNKKRRGRWLALAACLAVVLAIGTMQTWGNEPPAPVVLPEEQGQYHFLQFRMDRKQDAPGFSIFVDEESYCTYEQNGVYVIAPRLAAEGLPECRLEITWTGTPPEEEAVNVEAQMESLYRNVWRAQSGAVDSMWPPPWDAWIVWGDNGADWDAAQRLAWVVSDGQGGSFVLSAGYFTEATEGHGAMFYDMMCTFRAETEEVPLWQAQLEEAAERLLKDTLPEGASVGSIDYSVSGEGENARAAVSVQYRLGGEEPYEALTLELICSKDGWTQE